MELRRHSMNEIEYAITNFEEFLEADIGQGDLHMCSAEAALIALREQAERNKGCEWCKALSFNPYIGGCKLVFFKSKKHPKGEHAISVSVFDEYGEEQEPVLVQIDNCIRCGKRLEVEP
jgi:hypothetical protein